MTGPGPHGMPLSAASGSHSFSGNLNIAIEGSMLLAPGRDLNIQHHHHGMVGFEPIGAQDMEDAAADFVETEGYTTAWDRLRENGVVVLNGERKTGRGIAALRLMQRAFIFSQSEGLSLQGAFRL